MGITKYLKGETRQKQIDRLDKVYDLAYKDSMKTGYGFIAIKQCNKHGVMITQVTWSELRDIMIDLGVLGAPGGYDKTQAIFKKTLT